MAVPMKAPPKQRPVPMPKTGTIHGEAYPLISIEGNAYAKVNQRVESAHKNGGYTVLSCEYKKVLEIAVCEIWIELPNGQKFPGTAEVSLGTQKALAKAQTRAMGRALAFAGFNIETSIASGDEMEDVLAQRGTTVVESTATALPAPAKEPEPDFLPPEGKTWAVWIADLARELGIFDNGDQVKDFMQELTGKDPRKVRYQVADYGVVAQKLQEMIWDAKAQEEAEASGDVGEEKTVEADSGE